MIDINEERRIMLTTAVESRTREVMNHQINIDNYRLAVIEIEDNYSHDPHMQEFSTRLQDLLASSIVEQTKEKILLKVINAQLEA